MDGASGEEGGEPGATQPATRQTRGNYRWKPDGSDETTGQAFVFRTLSMDILGGLGVIIITHKT